MMHLLHLALFVTIVVTSSSSAQGIRNGDFETGTTNWSLKNGWGVDCNESYSGDCSARYTTSPSRLTPIGNQVFNLRNRNTCDLSVWIRTDLRDPSFWSDGEPTRTGLTVQLRNHAGTGITMPMELAARSPYRDGYRGQGGRKGWTKYTARVSVNPGKWEAKLFMYPVRSNVGGVLKKIANAKGTAWVDDIRLNKAQ